MTVVPTPPQNEQDSNLPGQRDADRTKHHYPLAFLLKLLGVLLLLFLLLCLALYVAAGTSRGTKFLLEKVISETGVKLEYGEGNLRDGLLVTDVALSASKDIDIHFINAYVKLGWRAIFVKEVHLRDADIERIEIVNRKPATGEPFAYKTLELPVDLRFDKARIGSIEYDQVGKKPIIVTDVAATDLSWIDTKVSVDKAYLQYGEVVKVADLAGFVQLEGNYPLDLEGTATVFSLEKLYVDPIEIQATGSLKRTYGLVRSKYNNSDVTGEFAVQGLDDNAPFDAKLMWDDVALPYAEKQDISLQNGLLVASGVLSDIELRFNTELAAKDIPGGHYRGRATIVDSQMRIERLQAQTPEGDLLMQGVLDWQDDFSAKVLAKGRDFDVRALLPEDAAPYAPKTLDGQLAVVFNAKNAAGLMQIDADLKQRDGEHVNANIIRGVTPDNPRYKAPWFIDARWRHVRRQDVPKVGNIDSPSGKASIKLRDNRLWVTANGKINELNAAPPGNYQLDMAKVNNRIDITALDYKGLMGDLTGKGSVLLATAKTPLTWQIKAKTNELLPQVFKADLPVTRLVGDIDAAGKMIDISKTVNGKTVSGQRHVFTINDSDLIITLASQVDKNNKDGLASKVSESRRVAVSGKGEGDVALLGGQLQQFAAKFDGQLDTQGVPKGHFVVNADGTPSDITLHNFAHQGEAGNVVASGKVGLKDGVQWDITADAQDFNVGYFSPQTEGKVSGHLVSSGKWRSNETKLGDLQAFAVAFDGSIDTPKLPKGKLVIDAGGNAKAIVVRKFSHIGEAGQLSAKGTVDVSNGIRWDINAVMNQFNLGYFVKGVPSTLTGRVASTGMWRDNEQRITVSQMALRGDIKGKPVQASGNLNAILHLPKDMNAYLAVLKAADTIGQISQFKAIVETLQADNLVLQWADNRIVADGNAQNLQAQVSINNLRQLSDSFSGKINGAMTLVQPKGQALPTIYVDLTGEKITLPNIVLTKGVIKGKIVDLGKSPSKLALLAEGLQAAGSQFNDVKVVFNGTEQAHTVSIQAGTTTAATNVGVKAVIKGGLEREQQRWRGVVGNGEVTTKYVALRQSQPAQLIASFGGNTPEVRLAAHCWQATDQSGKLCLQDNLIASSAQGKLNLAIQKLDTTLFAAFMPKDLSWQAKVDGRAVVGWKKGQRPSVDAALYSDDGEIGMVQEGNAQAVTMTYKRISLIAKSFAEGLKVRADINSGHGARGYADVVIDPYQKTKPISGALVLNEFNLAILKPFFPGMRRLEGGITMAGGVGGTLGSPVFYGDVNLKDASIAILDLPVNLSNINAKAKIRGQSATLNGTFMSGDGTGVLDGTIDWQQELQAKIRIRGERLVIAQPPLLFAEVNPDFNIIIKPKQQYVNIVGAVSVPTATIRPPEANEKVITKSDDVVVLDRRLIGNIDEVLAVSKPWSINADIGIDLGDDVYFRGFGAVLPLAGAIHVTQKGQGVLAAKGVVQVSRRSKIDAFGQNLELNYAQVRFNGDVLNPQLSIEAVKKIEGQTVGLRVKSTVSNPNIVVFNDAGLTQQQAMNALVTGHISNRGATQISEQGFKSEVTNTLAAAGLSFGLSGTRSLTNSIGKAFGLQSLTLDASGKGNSTNVNITGYITPDLYIRYGVGVFDAQSSLALRYQLTRRFYVEATSAAESAVDVVYSFQF